MGDDLDEDEFDELVFERVCCEIATDVLTLAECSAERDAIVPHV